MNALGWLLVAAWLWLMLFRGRFWQVEEGRVAAAPDHWPEVVAVIPARDEAETIAATVASLRAQDYRGVSHVIVVDDQSADTTAERARTAGATVISGSALPDGWVGKVWAMSQGVEAASRLHPEASLILFTDADIRHAPGELRRMVARLEAGPLDLASLLVRLSTIDIAERAVIPAFVYFFRMLYPFRWAGDPMAGTAAAAGGFMLIRRTMLARIGGLEAIRGALIDDCALAAAVKAHSGRIDLALAEETASLRRYDAPGLWQMIARSAFTQLRHSPLLLTGTVIGLLLVFVAPALLALFCPAARAPALIALALMGITYLPMVRFYRQSPLWAVSLPAVALFYLGATVDSARRHWQGRGGAWKGRVQT